jgi:hypothetical protein
VSSLPPGPPPSSPPPSFPPPSTPPPSTPPPSGPPPGAETLEYGAGGPIPPQPRPRSGGGGKRRWFLVAGGVVGLSALGAAAFGAWWYVSTGPQPAQALPAGTLAYASLDLDPSGAQKVDALRTLRELPAVDDEFDLSGDLGDIDVTRVLVERILAEVPCDVTYDADVESWLGDRAAVAAVDTGGEEPSPVFVVQVSDPDAAVEGFDELAACGSESDPEIGRDIVDDEWLVVAETPEIVADVVDETADGSLADDETYREWTDAAGDPGIVSLYAAPAAGEFLAENVEDLFFGASDFATTDELVMPGDELGDGSTLTQPPVSDEVTDEMTKALEDFEGMAMTLRFDDGAMEVEVAAGAGAVADDLPEGRGAEALETLPDDTAAALGLGFGEGWFDQMLASVAASLGEDEETLIADLEAASGLSLPEDAETLAGESLVLAIGQGFDLDAVFESEDGSDIPLAVKILGDPEGVEDVLGKVRTRLVEEGAPEELLGSGSEGDATAIGPSEDYRNEVLGDGGLGDSEVYQSVVPDQDGAAGVLFVDLDAVTELIGGAGAMGDEDEVLRNLDPLRALGVSSWLDDDGTSHALLRISTDD